MKENRELIVPQRGLHWHGEYAHGAGRGYLVLPKKLAGKAPSVLIVHENREWNPDSKMIAPG